jgi:hypothetical protein
MTHEPDTRKKPGPAERARIKAAKEAAAQAEQAAIAKAKALADAENAKRKAKHTQPATPVAKKQEAAPEPIAALAKRLVKEAVDDEDDEIVPLAVKREKKVRTKAEPRPDITMQGSRQREGTVDSGIVIKGGGVQVTLTFTAAQAAWLRARAAAAGVSFAEATRRAVNAIMDETTDDDE